MNNSCYFCGDKDFHRINPDIYDYCITLKNVGLPPLGKISKDVFVEPPLKHDLYFCGLECLKKWLDKYEIRCKRCGCKLEE